MQNRSRNPLNRDQHLSREMFIWVRYCTGGGGCGRPATIRTMRRTSTPTAPSTTTMSTTKGVLFAPLPLACPKLVRVNGGLCLGEKEYRSLSQGLRCRCGTDQRQCPWKNMPTEARTADETDRFSYICLWDAWVFYSRIPRAAFIG